MAKVIQTKAPEKGDLVVGHRVFAFLGDDLPAIPGVIVKAANHRVTMDVGSGFAALGLPKQTDWTWRRSVAAYQEEGQRTKRGRGLALDTRPRKSKAVQS